MNKLILSLMNINAIFTDWRRITENKRVYLTKWLVSKGLNWYQIIAWTIHNFPVLLFTKHIRFTLMDIHKTLIKMVK